jgi:hypothetical protein
MTNLYETLHPDSEVVGAKEKVVKKTDTEL